jgi:cob(I)alamin adenosyltransferase
MARRVERSVLAIEVTPEIQAFLNRLSSIMFVLARRTNDVLEIAERGPSYT